MAVRIKISSKNQIAVPAEMRKALGLKSGDYLLVHIRNGSAILVPEPDNYSEHLRGLHAEIWRDGDPHEYVQGERDAWNG